MDTQYRPPLALIVLWHPKFKFGEELAKKLYRHFCRDTSFPLSRGVGIPIFFWRNTPNADGTLPEIPLHYADRTVIVALLDDKFVNDPDNYKEKLAILAQDLSFPNQPHRLITVGMSTGVVYLPYISRLNLLRLESLPDSKDITQMAGWSEKNEPLLLRKIGEELCRILINQEVFANEISPDIYQSPAQLRLFLSYVRQDSLKLVSDLQSFVTQNSSIEIFWDTRSIALGSGFSEEISAGVATSMLVVFLTDAYSTRKWCLKEVMEAKRLRRPILVINALEKGELRSFPYLNNTTVIRWNGDKEVVLDRAIFEGIRFLYHTQEISRKAQVLLPKSLSKDLVFISARPPELIDFALQPKISLGKSIFAYPDPPISDVELRLIEGSCPEMKFLTPNHFPNFRVGEKSEYLLEGKKIALSIGNLSEAEHERNGFGFIHELDIFIEFVRYLFAAEADVIYAGYLEGSSFTKPLIEMATEYRREDGRPRIYNPIGWPHCDKIGEGDEAHYTGLVKFKKFGLDSKIVEIIKEDPQSQNENHVLGAIMANSASRNYMPKIENARIIMGGRLEGYSGFVPGVLEEAYRALEADKPLFVIGGLGGCAEAICRILVGEPIPELLSDAYVKETGTYRSKIQTYNKFENLLDELAVVPVSPEALAKAIQAKGIAGLKNGLSESENLQLFKTRHVPEMVSLVLKGLSKVFRKAQA